MKNTVTYKGIQFKRFRMYCEAISAFMNSGGVMVEMESEADVWDDRDLTKLKYFNATTGLVWVAKYL